MEEMVLPVVVGSSDDGGDGRGEETLPGAKKYFQPLAFNY